MAQYVYTRYLRETVSVGVLSTIVVPVLDLRGYEYVVLEVINDSVSETFDGIVETSVDGAAPFATLPDDAFASMGPGATRFLQLDSSYQFVRISGTFTAPDSVRRTAILSRNRPSFLTR